MFLAGLFGFFLIYCLGFYNSFLTNRKNWDTFTRCVSMFNALQCIYMVYNANLSNILSLYYIPSLNSTNSLFLFSAYLFVDGLFQLPDLCTNFSLI